MKLSFSPILVLLVTLGLSGCYLDVKDAFAPSNPPQLENVKFETANIVGKFSRFEGGGYRRGVSPKMFLWPKEKRDPKTGEFVPMTFDEQVEVRKNITAAADELAEFERAMEEADSALVAKYEKLKSEAVAFWKENKCYSYCSEEAFFCTPDDETNLEIDPDDWVIISCEEQDSSMNQCVSDAITPADPEGDEGEELPVKAEDVDVTSGCIDAVDPIACINEKIKTLTEVPVDCATEKEALIACWDNQRPLLQCQANQDERLALDDEQSKEYKEVVLPLQQKAGDSALNLLATVGDANYFGDIGLFQFIHGEFECFADTSDCVEAKGRTNTYIQVEYGELKINNFEGNDTPWVINDVELDVVDGFVTFSIPAVDLSTNEIIGLIFFDLEFVSDTGRLQINGDIKQIIDGREQMGRFASSGVMVP